MPFLFGRQIPLEPKQLVSKLARLVRYCWSSTRQFNVDCKRSTYGYCETAIIKRRFEPINRSLLKDLRESLTDLAAHTLRHEFNVFGSGWIRVARAAVSPESGPAQYRPDQAQQMDPQGLWLTDRINPANIHHSQRIWKLVDTNYAPIDWQLDFKSGFRWNERTWFRHIAFGNVPEVDVKVPWELARMQHLPRLAMAFAIEQGEKASSYQAEFQNQILDFLATNPPRFGVNWRCTMDVAIRAANIAVAYDLFCAHGSHFQLSFRKVVAQSLYDHGAHCFRFLDRNGPHRGNHYLANIAGLAIIAAYLEECDVTDSWLTFSAKELLSEVAHQFTPDGSNFEGSTSYHRLSAECVAWATAALLGVSDRRQHLLKQNGIDLTWLSVALSKMKAFARDTNSPRGGVVQIGDNDSGHFLQILPAPDQQNNNVLPGEEYLEKIIDGLFMCPNDRKEALDTLLIRSFSQGAFLPAACGSQAAEVFGESCMPAGPSEYGKLIFELSLSGAEVNRHAYPDFGLFIFKNDFFMLAVRCHTHLTRRSTHAHEDHLSIELHANGKRLLADPGTFTYTADPVMRKKYWSISAHQTPFSGLAIGLPSGEDIFRLQDRFESNCLYFGPQGFAGEMIFQRKLKAWRHVYVDPYAVKIWDYYQNDVPLLPAQHIPYSPAYGVLDPL